MNNDSDEQKQEPQTASFDQPKQSKQSTRRTWKAAIVRWIKILSITGIASYVMILVMLAYSETSLVYPGSTYPKGNWDPKSFDFDEVTFTSPDGTELVGWYLPSLSKEDRDDCRTVLICHGNAENVAEVSGSWGVMFRDRLKAEVFAFDYRGYGKCEGTPNEKAVCEDTIAALDYLCQRTGKPASEIIVVGHSLGGGPAVNLAKSRGCRMLILQRTYSSLPDAAASLYPIFPVHWIMQNRMNSAEKIRDCPMPLFQSHGNVDHLIPIESGKKLFAQSPATQKQFYEVEGMGHWDPLPEDYWKQLKAFVEEVDSSDSLK